jgi:hypothetical protein
MTPLKVVCHRQQIFGAARVRGSWNIYVVRTLDHWSHTDRRRLRLNTQLFGRPNARFFAERMRHWSRIDAPMWHSLRRFRRLQRAPSGKNCCRQVSVTQDSQRSRVQPCSVTIRRYASSLSTV